MNLRDLETIKNAIKEVTIKQEYRDKNLTNFLSFIEKTIDLDVLPSIFAKIDYISDILTEQKFTKSKNDQLELGNYLKKLGDDLIKYANEHVEQLEDDDEDKDSSKMKKEVRKEIDDFLDEIFGGK